MKLIFPALGHVLPVQIYPHPSRLGTLDEAASKRALALHEERAEVSARVRLLAPAESRALQRRWVRIWSDEQRRSTDSGASMLSEECEGEVSAWNRDVICCCVLGVDGVQVGDVDLAGSAGESLARHLESCGMSGDVAQAALRAQRPTARQLER